MMNTDSNTSDEAPEAPISSKTKVNTLPMFAFAALSAMVLIIGKRYVDPWIAGALAGIVFCPGVIFSYIPAKRRSVVRIGSLFLIVAIVEAVIAHFLHQSLS